MALAGAWRAATRPERRDRGFRAASQRRAQRPVAPAAMIQSARRDDAPSARVTRAISRSPAHRVGHEMDDQLRRRRRRTLGRRTATAPPRRIRPVAPGWRSRAAATNDAEGSTAVTGLCAQPLRRGSRRRRRRDRTRRRARAGRESNVGEVGENSVRGRAEYLPHEPVIRLRAGRQSFTSRNLTSCSCVPGTYCGQHVAGEHRDRAPGYGDPGRGPGMSRMTW